MFVCSYIPMMNLHRIIAFDTCCDFTHNKRNVKNFKFYMKSDINQSRFNVR